MQLWSSLHPSDQAAKSTCSPKANLTCNNLPRPLNLPASPQLSFQQRIKCAILPSHGFPSVVSMPVTSFSFCLGKVVSSSSASPGKSWLGFRFISSSAHETITPFPLTRSHGAHPLPGLPLQMRLFSFLGLNGLYPGSLGAGCSRGPATSSRNPPSPGGRDGSSSFPSHPFRPHSLPMLTPTGQTASRLPQHRSSRSSSAPSSF